MNDELLRMIEVFIASAAISYPLIAIEHGNREYFKALAVSAIIYFSIAVVYNL